MTSSIANEKQNSPLVICSKWCHRPIILEGQVFCAYKSIVVVHCFSNNPMMRNVHFHSEVPRALLKKRKKTRDWLKKIPSTNLVDEDEVSSRCSEFQRIVRFQKQQLHEHHLQRKKCRLPVRKDIIEAFCKIYENQAWEHYSKLNRPLLSFLFLTSALIAHIHPPSFEVWCVSVLERRCMGSPFILATDPFLVCFTSPILIFGRSITL